MKRNLLVTILLGLIVCNLQAANSAYVTEIIPFHDATKPVFKKLYEEVACGNEAQRSIDTNSKPDYREGLEKELKALRESEMWQAGAVVRKLRPENK